MLFGIIYVSAVMFLVMSNAMGELGAIGGGMGNMPMLPGMGGIDASTKSALGNIIDLNRIAGTFSSSEIELFLSSSSSYDIMNIDLMMAIIWNASIAALIEIGVGASAFAMGIGMFKGKKLARIVVIVDSIISIPLVVIFVTADVLVILGMVAVNGVVLTYMLKSKAREYFNQTSIKKAMNRKKSKIKKLGISESKLSESEIKELVRPWYKPPDKEVNVRRMIIYSFLPFVVVYAAWRIKKFWVLFGLSLVLPALFTMAYVTLLLIPTLAYPFSFVLEIIVQVYIIKHYARKYNENLLKLNG